MCRMNSTYCETQPPALSSVVCLSSVPHSDISTYLHYMIFPSIQTIYFLWGYDSGNMSVSFIAELSPVYWCLVFAFLWYFGVVITSFLNLLGSGLKPFGVWFYAAWSISIRWPVNKIQRQYSWHIWCSIVREGPIEVTTLRAIKLASTSTHV